MAKYRCFISLFLLALFGCAQPECVVDVVDYSADNSSLYTNSLISIAELKNRYLGSSHAVVDDVVIEGRVVANDIYGEFYKVLVIEDSTAAVEVRIDSYDLYESYPIGSLVWVVCDDLWLSSRGGTVIVGSEPSADDYLLGYISDDLLSRSIILSSESVEEVVATEITIPELDISMISRRVRLYDLAFAETTGLTFAERDEETGYFVETTHTLYDTDGNEIELVVSSLVSYAEVALPLGLVDLEAIVEYSSGEFSLRIACFLISL